MKRTVIAYVAALLTVVPSFSRTGVVVAHYGSSNDATRELTINKITGEINEAVGNAAIVREAYISPVVRQNLSRRGLVAMSPTDAMLSLRAEGVDTLIVQPSLIIDGGEMEEVTRAVDEVRPFFEKVVVGRPLCYTPSDFEKVVDILAVEDPDGADAIIFVGHGNELPSTATYTQLDYMLTDRGLTGRHVSTIEGYPTAETTARQLRRESKRMKKVKLVPFLLVCGNHTLHDIAGEYSDSLRELGFEPEVLKRGLAELPAIRKIYTERVLNMLGHSPE